MSHDLMRETLIKLFPPGSQDSLAEDPKAMALLDAIAKEFAAVFDLATTVFSPPLDRQSHFFSSWQKLCKNPDPVAALQAKGHKAMALGQEWLVSNTKAHFQSIVGANIEIKTGKNTIEFIGLKNKKTSLPNTPWGKVERDEALISLIEKTKHAHVTAKYKENHA